MEIKTMEHAQEVMNQSFSMIIAKSRTCSACQTILQIMRQNIPNLDQINIHQVYVDELEQFRGEQLIFAVPTVLIFSEGKELLRESRYINYSKIERLISLYND
jgi:hypothetical protein